MGTEKRKVKPLPGPRGWPIVGLGFELTPENMFSKLSQYTNQYGDVFTVKLFGTNVVVLSSAELIRKALNTDPYEKVMNDRRRTFFGESVLFGSQTAAFMERAYESKHCDLREDLIGALHVYGEVKKDAEDLIQVELGRLIEQVESNGDQEFNFQGLIKSSIENIIAIMLSGHALKTEEESRMLWEFIGAGAFFLNPKTDIMMRTFPFLGRMPSIYKDQYTKMMSAKEALTKIFYTDAKATYKVSETRGIVDIMIGKQIQSQQNGGEVLFTDERIIGTILETFGAGVVTIINTLSSLFLCLMNHPEYQVKIQEELDQAIGIDKRPTLADMASCPMAEAVALETLRYIPVLPGLIPHVCNSSVEFEGFDIPKNSMIIPNAFHVNHDEKIWGDPWTFRPERFLDDDGALLPKDHLFRQSMLTFGTGQRQCLGESVATTRMFLILTTLLQRWSFELPPGKQISCDPRYGDFNWNINLCPRPFHCQVVPRNIHSAPMY